VSQSPLEDATEATITNYRQGWQALNRLLHEDRSFSGHEKHMAFLNTGGARFADISSVSGFDFSEDGRAISPVDWDFDGDLDLWVTNRTAPRIRYLENQNDTAHHFVALQLEGTGRSSNRDAIGARVTVDGPAKLIKTVRAGERFLSQSSGWMHFGLGKHTKPLRITVEWPAGQKEVFASVSPDQFHVLRQGRGKAERWMPPAVKLEPKIVSEPTETAFVRIILPEGLPLPDIATVSGPLKLESKSTILNVWASWCQPCLDELKDWAARSDRFREAGLEVVLLNADIDADGRAKAAAFLKENGIPFRSLEMNEEGIRALDVLQRAMLDHWEALPVPSSFLIDHEGYVKALYKGPLETDVLLVDLPLLGADGATRRQAGVPFPGKWTHDVPVPDPMRVCSQFIDHALISEGLNYLRKATEMDGKFRASQFTKSELADRYLVMATILQDQKRVEQAIDAYRAARDLNPKDFRVRLDLGNYLHELGRVPEALEEWQASLQINANHTPTLEKLTTAYLQMSQPENALKVLDKLVALSSKHPGYHFYRGTALRQLGRVPEAVKAFAQTLTIQPDHLLAGNNFAWIRATHPEKSMRDPELAVRIAQAVNRRTKHQQPNFLSTLAVAEASYGRFDKAVEATDAALAILQQDPSKHAAEIARHQERRALFVEKKAFVDKEL
jgi:tetratricopeptide (TPR) repeat protein